ncbi:hypothetical protein ONZ51_g10007 [Trametes cubensis]|uniref:Uncharacterized protein n=1 Tax=Trametes cubensis TaxID=1111947 RepID=A0AAD7TMU3_9APHY|nr:hypothetical protein ONZ51_g10007 [Trametes cubensis]
MMFKSIAALSLLILYTWAAPAKRDDAGITLPGVGVLTIPGIAPGETISPEEALSILSAGSQAIATAVPILTSAIAQAQVGFVYSQALTKVPPTATQVSVFIAGKFDAHQLPVCDLTRICPDVSGTPVVEVSSVGGAGITLATGNVTTGVFTTEIAGQVFTAVPKKK